MEKRVNTELTLNSVEELNLKIFQQEAEKFGFSSENVRGTGVFREFVPQNLQSDLCDRPPRDSRPNDLKNMDGIIVSNDSDSGTSTFEYKESSTGFFKQAKSLFSSNTESSSSYLDDNSVCLSNDPDGIEWNPNKREEKSVGLFQGIENLICGEEWNYCEPSSLDIGIYNDDNEIAVQNADLNDGYCTDNQSIMDKMFDLFGHGLFGSPYGYGEDGGYGEIRDPSLMMPPTSLFYCPPPTD